MKICKKLIGILLLLTLTFINAFAKENKSILIAIWQQKVNTFKFQNNEFEVSLNPVDYTLNPVILNKQKEIIFEPADYVELLEVTEINENKYSFCFSALGFEQTFIYDVKKDTITEPFFDMKKQVSIWAKDYDNLVLFGDTWNSDKDIMPDQTISLYLFSTAKQQHYKIADKKGDVFHVKLLDDCKIEYADQNGNLVQFDYTEWIMPYTSYTASSFLVERTAVYGADNLESEQGLPWASANGYGINDTIQIKTLGHNKLQLALYNGFQSKERPDLYKANSRVKRIKIKNLETGTSSEFLLKDTSEKQIIYLNSLDITEKKYTTLEITILEVYPGDKYTDLCIQAIIPVY